MSRASSIHEAERQHGSVGELHPFDKINPFKRLKPSRTASTSSTTLEDVALGNRPGPGGPPPLQASTRTNPSVPNVTPAYMPATFDTSSGLRRMGSQPAVTGLFGGASPSEGDEGYPPVRSEEEALARHVSLRDRHGPHQYQHQSSNQPASGGPGPTRTRSRGLSLVGAAANFAVAGFGMGESDQELVGRTLSRVSTHKSYQTTNAGGRREGKGAGAGVAIPAKTLGGHGMEEEKERRSSGSDHTRIGEGDSIPSSSSDSQAQLPDPEKTAAAAADAAEPTEDELYMVRFEPGEKTNPKNWSVAYRWYITGAGSLLVLNSTFASSAPSGIVKEMTEYFGFGREVATLTVSLFVAG